MPSAGLGTGCQLGEGCILPRDCPMGAVGSSPASSVLPMSACGLQSLEESDAWCWGDFSWV